MLVYYVVQNLDSLPKHMAVVFCMETVQLKLALQWEYLQHILKTICEQLRCDVLATHRTLHLQLPVYVNEHTGYTPKTI